MTPEEKAKWHEEQEALRQQHRREKASARMTLGDGWAERLLGMDPADGLREMVAAHVRIHDAAIVSADFKAAGIALKDIAHLTGYGRTLTDGVREAASKSLDDRCREMLEDEDTREAMRRALDETE